MHMTIHPIDAAPVMMCQCHTDDVLAPTCHQKNPETGVNVGAEFVSKYTPHLDRLKARCVRAAVRPCVLAQHSRPRFASNCLVSCLLCVPAIDPALENNNRYGLDIEFNPCISDWTPQYLNRPDVKAAIHVDSHFTRTWPNHPPGWYYNEGPEGAKKDIALLFPKFFDKAPQWKIIVVSGDADSGVWKQRALVAYFVSS